LQKIDEQENSRLGQKDHKQGPALGCPKSKAHRSRENCHLGHKSCKPHYSSARAGNEETIRQQVDTALEIRPNWWKSVFRYAAIVIVLMVQYDDPARALPWVALAVLPFGLWDAYAAKKHRGLIFTREGIRILGFRGGTFIPVSDIARVERHGRAVSFVRIEYTAGGSRLLTSVSVDRLAEIKTVLDR
jgi:hypothetical protein